MILLETAIPLQRVLVVAVYRFEAAARWLSAERRLESRQGTAALLEPVCAAPASFCIGRGAT
jgi:hypothetical protein